MALSKSPPAWSACWICLRWNFSYSASASSLAISCEILPAWVKDGAFVHGQEAVELGDPVAHVHGHAAHGLAFGKDEVLLDEIVQRGEFRFVEVVLGDGDILLAHFRAAPVGQAHVGLGGCRRGRG